MTRHPPSGAHGSAGFTLLEVLVAITLLGLLSVGLFGAVHIGGQGWRRAERHSAATEDATAVQDVLLSLIAGAQPVFASADPADATVAFDGRPRSLTLVGPLPAAIAAGQQGQERLFLAASGDSRTLMLAWRLDLPAADGGTLPETVVPLLDHVQSIRFAYFVAAGHGEAEGWRDTWVGRHRLPALVRLQVDRDTGGAGPWPDLVAAPLATVSTECGYEGLDAACHRTP